MSRGGGGHVAGGVDVRVGGAQRRVDGHTAAGLRVGEVESGLFGECGAGGGTDRGEHVVGGVLLAVVGAHGENHAVLSDDLGEAGAEVEAHAVFAVQIGEQAAEFGSQDAVQGCRGGLDDGDLGAVGAGRGGDLQTDPAGAGDHQMPVVPPEGGQDAAQPFGVGEAAQVVHAGQAGAGDVQAARLGAGGQQQLVVGDQGAVAEADGLRLGVEADGGLAQVQFDLCLGVPGGFMDENAVALFLAEQEPLGERGALVRVVALVTDEDHPAGEPFRAESLRGLCAGQATPDDDERLVCVDHLLPPRCGAVRPRPRP